MKSRGKDTVIESETQHIPGSLAGASQRILERPTSVTVANVNNCAVIYFFFSFLHSFSSCCEAGTDISIHREDKL